MTHITLPLGSFNTFTHQNIQLEPFEIFLQSSEMVASVLEPSERNKQTKDVIASFKYPKNPHVPHDSLEPCRLRMEVGWNGEGRGNHPIPS